MNFKKLAEKIQPFLAIAIFLTLILLAVLLYQDNKLKEEIKINCGWGEEDYYCYCEKSVASEFKNKYEEDLDFGNIKMDG